MSSGSSTTPLLEVRSLSRHYRLPRPSLWQPAPRLQALSDIGFVLPAGRSLGVVGESGSGKSTLARAVMALDEPQTHGGGQVLLDGKDLHALAPEALRQARRQFQMVFQDPYGSLDPRRRVGAIVAEPLAALLRLPVAEQAARALDSLQAVGLSAADLHKYPHEFSGGQRQRIAIARALATSPRLIVADEPVSALDVSVQAQVLNLLLDLRQRLGLSFLLISHDLAVVDHVCDEVLVLYQGRVVEQGEPAQLFRAGAHPYTRLLVDAVPRVAVPKPGQPRRRHVALAQDPARPDPQAAGCAFAARCPRASARCTAERPVLAPLQPGHLVACHHPH